MFGKKRTKMIRLHPFKEKKGGFPLGGQWKENEKLPMFGGQWKEKEKVPFYPFSFSPQQIYSNLSFFKLNFIFFL
jgi:hypothetical protein